MGFLSVLCRDALTALKLVCWLNTLEKRLFSAPYEGKDCDEKFQVSALYTAGIVLAQCSTHSSKLVMCNLDSCD
jgi:hypothetical protein